MTKTTQRSSKHPLAHTGAESARAKLPSLIDAAERGRATVIKRRGRAVAVLAPMSAVEELNGQQSLLPMQGSGRGLWGADSRKTLRKLRDEWNR